MVNQMINIPQATNNPQPYPGEMPYQKVHPDNDVERAGFDFVSDFIAFTNDENRVCAPKDKGGLSPDDDEVLFLVPGGTYFHLEPSHAVHTRQCKYWDLS